VESPIRDPYAALAELRSEPDVESPLVPPVQTSFASGVEALAEIRPEVPVETERPGSFFGDVSGSGGTDGGRHPDAPEPSPELRSFFETGAAERAELEHAAAETPAEEPYSWSYEPLAPEPTTYHVEPAREPTL